MKWKDGCFHISDKTEKIVTFSGIIKGKWDKGTMCAYELKKRDINLKMVTWGL